MNLVSSVINDLSEIDFDGLFERAKDAVNASWPASSPMTDEEKKEAMRSIINSGVAGNYIGADDPGPDYVYHMAVTTDTDTGLVMSLVCGFISPDGTFDGRHSLTAADANGSRNWLYQEQNRLARIQGRTDHNITKALYRNIPEGSVFHRFIKMRAAAGHYEVVEDVESYTGHRNITIRFL